MDNRTKRDGIPTTSVPRTLLDLGAVADERILRPAVNQADRAGWLNRRERWLDYEPREVAETVSSLLTRR